MVTTSIIKHLLCDDDSLMDYYQGRIVSFEDVSRRLFLLERRNNSSIPDHYYLLNREHSLIGLNKIADILSKGIAELSCKHLEIKRVLSNGMPQNRIHVLQEMQNEWQSLLPFIPPLVLQTALLQKNKALDTKDPIKIQGYSTEFLLSNFKYTALPYPHIPQIEQFIRESNGFHDLHMHLNGSIETDIAWQDFMFTPKEIYELLEKTYKDKNTRQMVTEQLEQESHFAKPIEFYNLLRIARRLRSYFFLMTIDNAETQEIKKKNGNILFNNQVLTAITSLDKETFIGDSVRHPFMNLLYPTFPLGSRLEEDKRLMIEALMHIIVIQKIKDNSTPEILASMYHFYLLILGLSNRLLVQQTHQFGFQQFQKLTLNDLRSNAEKRYRSRFLQLHGNELRNIKFMEGRFSPKENESKNITLISEIERGWEALLATLPSNHPKPQLKLIAHFIKQKDTNPDQYIRHKKLRINMWNKAMVLAYMKKNNPRYIRNVIGIDAASSEFDTPPEVFAPVFRFLRRKGFQHFTYHAGEDFFHIIGGLRAIYEAIEFNELKHGDRIGHATACGVDSEVWIQNVGCKILIRQGEYLDDLVFAHYLIVTEQINELKHILPYLVNKIIELNHSIYKQSFTIKSIEEAWLMRKYCPSIIQNIALSSKDAWNNLLEFNPLLKSMNSSTFDFNEWNDIHTQIVSKYGKTSDAISLFRIYHNLDCREDYNKIIEVEVESLFDIQSITLLQKKILQYMHKKEIVIESLPTSNIRIGHHHSFETYHLWNWMKWEDEGESIPPIVLGTDDTGIFATNIYNEYANIYCYLTAQCKASHSKAMSFIEKLNKNALIYRFE